MKKWTLNIFTALVFLSLLTPFWVFSHLQFPYITSKAFYFRIIVELALPFYFYLILSEKSLRPKLKSPLNLVALIFLAINLITAFTGENIARSLWGNFERMGGVYYLAHLVLLFFYIQLLGQAGKNYLKRFLQGFILVALFLTINGISGWLGGPTLTKDASLPARVSSTFGNPIFFASFLILPMFVAGYLALTEENRKLKIFYWSAAILQLLGIYSSGTRGAAGGVIIALFVGLVAFVVLTKNFRLRRLGLMALILFLFVAGGFYAFSEKFTPGSTLRRLANLRDSNTEARLLQWKIALQGYKDSPWLGVGPENYYVIFDTHYDPLMYKYDASWFDKPHNYLLEILTTNGIFGLLSYGAMVLFAFYGLWKAYKKDLLELKEFCFLSAGMLAYQIQNLTVFDTVSPSVAFYVFLGFVSFIWAEVHLEEKKKNIEKSGNNTRASIILALSGLIILYLVYISNVTSIQAAKRVNFGYVYADYNPKIAADYFRSALALPFNLDPRETANRFSDFASDLLDNELVNKDKEFVSEQLDLATANQRAVAEQTRNDPLLWMRLAIDELNQTVLHNKDLEEVIPTIEKAISLAPKRVELLQLKIQLYSAKKDWEKAKNVAEETVNINPFSPALHWQLAMAYYLNGQIEEAVLAGDEAVLKGFKFTQLQQFAWYIQYYLDKKDNQKLVPLLERAVDLQPNEIALYFELAKANVALGNLDRAESLARQIMVLDPSQTQIMKQFIESLK